MRAQLAAMAEPVRLVAGHDLYREADDADSFFILQEGGCSRLCRLVWLLAAQSTPQLGGVVEDWATPAATPFCSCCLTGGCCRSLCVAAWHRALQGRAALR